MARRPKPAPKVTDDAQLKMLTNLGVSSTIIPDDNNEAENRQAKYVYVEGNLFTH